MYAIIEAPVQCWSQTAISLYNHYAMLFILTLHYRLPEE